MQKLPTILTLVAVTVVVATVTSCGHLHLGPVLKDTSQARAEAEARRATIAFFDRYVDDTGRVVRHDQGGDTLSEGQGYALLLADAIGDRRRFELVWRWTKNNLLRSDHLFSWRWDSGVVGDQPAADADLDIARALVLAGKRFDEPEWTDEGVKVGQSILDRETAVVDGRRILLPGPWSKQRRPLLVNVSYVSPVATSLLADASGDPRWSQLAVGSRAVIASLARTKLPPDWAVIEDDGSIRPSSPDPDGQPRFSYDAVRTPIRAAESCARADRRRSGSMAELLAASRAEVMTHPVGWVARAASEAAAGRPESAGKALAKAAEAVRAHSSYYGDAWNALGRFMLLDGRLGGCPPQVQMP